MDACSRLLVPAAAQGFSLKSLQHLVLDEADRLLNMDFEAEIDQILKAIPRERRTQLFRRAERPSPACPAAAQSHSMTRSQVMIPAVMVLLLPSSQEIKCGLAYNGSDVRCVLRSPGVAPVSVEVVRAHDGCHRCPAARP